jgi:DNA-binding transcriptional ArsR family regulator
MSAVPANVVDFKLPKRKPKVIEKEAPPDKRTVAVLPIRAINDKGITDACFRTLAALCSYCNRAGITWVSQKRLAEDMKVSRQAITKQLTKLKAAGYVEITRKGFRGERSNTLRVIFDPTLTAQDAIAVTSGIEDTRPPEQIKREEELRNIMADNDLPDLSPEQIKANMKRLEALLGTLGRPSNFRTHQPQTLGALMADTKPVQKRTRSAQPKVAHNTSPDTNTVQHRQPNTVANEEGLHRQPESVNNTLHRQPHRQPNRVAKNTENIGLIELYRLYEIKKKGLIKDSDMKWANLAVEVGVTESEMVAAMSQVETLAEACRLVLDARGL